MKLRNKKNGMIYKLSSLISFTYDDGSDFWKAEYLSLAKLNEEWEDYNPTEPLIKDEKIRKAVRVWAEVNDVANVFIAAIKDAGEGCLYWELATSIDWEQSITIRFGGELPNTLKDERRYTIAELCGEDEE